ncbi:MAG TPA: alpha/beta hydrolase [Bacteroidales bacterium]|nr:alpha/beta hydrolase [Bacteroidales bacterium]
MKKIIVILVALLFSQISFAQDNQSRNYQESDLTLTTPTGSIYGTLTIPNGCQKCPIVIIIAGSGPTDRNGNSIAGVDANSYKMISEGLAQEGIATLRYDKRGIAASKDAMTGEKDIRFENYIDDVVLWIQMIKRDDRFKNIYVLGHSEGSLIGIVAAEREKVKGYISVSGIGDSADKTLREQLKNKLPIYLMVASNKILDSLKVGKTVENVDKNLMSIYRPSIQPYLISWFKYDPSVEIAKLKIPILILQGTTDIQVTPKDAQKLWEGNKNAKLVIIENMNHVLKESPMDQKANLETYKKPTLPLKKELLEEIIRFIHK